MVAPFVFVFGLSLVSSPNVQVKLVSAEMGLVLYLFCLAAVSWSQVGSTSTDCILCWEPAKVICLRELDDRPRAHSASTGEQSRQLGAWWP